jgi:hypothetical protein
VAETRAVLHFHNRDCHTVRQAAPGPAPAQTAGVGNPAHNQKDLEPDEGSGSFRCPATSHFTDLICGKVHGNMTRTEWADYVPDQPYQQTWP